ncbi:MULTISPECIES: restriction endonuclease [unclassified Streptomyces]|uniref:restriction endonuclease n=1 Tax=unclassified Streptomyces TaxID=2593676 RepID=UPI002E36CC18|nr:MULTISPECIES: restriction endonuclease [unclassified Streptomyces]WUC63738.1 restriction endonuclease [Streptomyces sp. NBC_00539]
MTMPTERIPGPTRAAAGGRRRFSLRATAWWFAAVALLVCGAGFAVRILAGAAAAHPAAAALVVAACATAAWSFARAGRRLRLRRTARRAARALECAAAEIAATEIATAEPEPVAPETAAEWVDYDALDGDAFEGAVAELCERDGCRDVRVVGGAGDLGADIVALAPDGRRVVIQCKRYCATNKVGSQDMQRFGGTCYAVHGADVAAVVTTSDFTTPAAEYAEQCGILCFDRQALHAWSASTGPAPWG